MGADVRASPPRSAPRSKTDLLIGPTTSWSRDDYSAAIEYVDTCGPTINGSSSLPNSVGALNDPLSANHARGQGQVTSDGSYSTCVTHRFSLTAARRGHRAIQVMNYDTPFQPGHKKESPTWSEIPPHEVEHSRAAPQPTRKSALGRSPVGRGADRLFAGRKDVSRNQEIRETCRAPVQTLRPRSPSSQ